MLWLRARRRRWLANPHLREPLRSLFHGAMPAGRTVFSDLECVSLDLETTGLDPRRDSILCAGWVVIRNNRVQLSTARRVIVQSEHPVGASATIHGLTDSKVSGGEPIAAVMDEILATLSGRALVVHHASLDKALLDRECRRSFGAPLLVPTIDTLALEARRQARRHHLDQAQSLQLGAVRNAYGLPRYRSHDALTDAIATGELLIAMVARSGANRVRLRELL